MTTEPKEVLSVRITPSEIEMIDSFAAFWTAETGFDISRADALRRILKRLAHNPLPADKTGPEADRVRDAAAKVLKGRP